MARLTITYDSMLAACVARYEHGATLDECAAISGVDRKLVRSRLAEFFRYLTSEMTEQLGHEIAKCEDPKIIRRFLDV